jgi:16S rRNA (guanine527-N7)-methyltransferase
LEQKIFLESDFISKKQKILLSKYLEILSEHNAHTNLVGKSTLVDPWNSHVLDSIQIAPLIENKALSILDMGSGAGFPGNVLSIAGFKDVTLLDSNGKKTDFLRKVKKEMYLKSKIITGRIEVINNKKYDVVVSRALANLSKLFSYSQKIIKKNTVMIFLKGKTVNEEIAEAKKKWLFDFVKHQSVSDLRGKILTVRNLKKND